MTWDEAIAYVTERFLGDLSCDSLTQEEAEVIAKMRLAATAQDIQTRRQWDVKFDRKAKCWYVPIHLGWENCQKVYADDPVAALIEAEGWINEYVCPACKNVGFISYQEMDGITTQPCSRCFGRKY